MGMKPEHKEYILKNINRDSVKEISRKLNIKEKQVRRFIQQQKNGGRQQDNLSPETGMPVQKKQVFFSVLLIIVLAFAVYGNSFRNEFLWDDKHLIEDNVFIKDWAHLPKYFVSGIGAGAGEKYASYRPLQMVTYNADYSLWKFDVRGYHLTSTILHICTALAVFWLVNILGKNAFLSFITAIFFVIHPIQTEAVTYVAGRADPLALLFMLLCLIFYIKGTDSKGTAAYLLMLLSYVLALLSKENSLILPALLLLYHYSYKKRIEPVRFCLISAMACIYVLLRVTVLKPIMANFDMPSTSVWQRAPGFFAAIAHYLRLLFFPLDQHMEYGGNRLFAWGNIQVMIGAFLVFFMLAYTFRKKGSNPSAFFSAYWFFLALLPVSNLYPINAFMSEHWLYTPSVGFFLLAALGLDYLYRNKNLRIYTVVLILALMVFYSCLTFRQNRYWKDPETFYKRTLKYAAHFPRLHYNLGNLYYYSGRIDEAVRSYEEALKIDPGYLAAYNNLGTAYYALGKKNEAMAAYEQALSMDPDDVEATNNLGVVYKDLGKTEEALRLYNKALKIDPNFASAYNNIAEIYYRSQQYEQAIEYFDKAVELGHSNSVFSDLLKPYRK
ncbi:MAG: tetratricopeptide repeat protein [Candidatus Omnitrophica bacterium]|nr:tetratricopeptide repeat protein [Candidatus Omnitrophota bacterium]